MRIDPKAVVSPLAPTTRARKDATHASERAPHGITARLAAIRAQVARGEFAVDLDLLASRIVGADAARR